MCVWGGWVDLQQQLTPMWWLMITRFWPAKLLETQPVGCLSGSAEWRPYRASTMCHCGVNGSVTWVVLHETQLFRLGALVQCQGACDICLQDCLSRLAAAGLAAGGTDATHGSTTSRAVFQKRSSVQVIAGSPSPTCHSQPSALIPSTATNGIFVFECSRKWHEHIHCQNSSSCAVSGALPFLTFMLLHEAVPTKVVQAYECT